MNHSQCQEKWYDLKADLSIKKVYLKHKKKPKLALNLHTETITTTTITENPDYFKVDDGDD